MAPDIRPATSVAARQQAARQQAARRRRLLAERARLLRRLSELEPFRRGSLTVIRRRCGRRCACARAGHPGHGPQSLLTWKEGGKGRSRSVRPGADLARVRRQLAAHGVFRDLVRRLVAVSEALCALDDPRPPARR